MSYSVLVCDDSTVARKQVMRCLSSNLDVEISQAKNGQEAVEILQNSQIDLLCLDLTMPILDGIGVLEAIKANKIETYVVVISADIQDKMKVRVAQLGALKFLEKPVKPEQLLSLLSEYGIR
ncbi:response regulator [Pseudoalteromonas luteoviolacea]|uniref:response regulator n=1 Tax=Pseudoalteromonas luteoviolacea TaxID=43657 RepID=UPI0007B09FD7|nr:response regulator [Pseudoalteromonas luteoviolacea]MBQ4877647.1 response regulator [Pseudoalteromonas luteoviolacea]MBQ4906682.1 response regulator [Pseudoalteromonas luteoviolacea]